MKLKKVTTMVVAATAAATTTVTPMMSIVANAEDKEAKSPKENLEDAKVAEQKAKEKEAQAKASFDKAQERKDQATEAVKGLEKKLEDAKSEANDAFAKAPEKANKSYVDAKSNLDSSLKNQQLAQSNVDEVLSLMKEAEKQVQIEIEAVKEAEKKVKDAQGEIDQKKETLDQAKKAYDEKKAAVDTVEKELAELNNNKNATEEQKKAAEEALKQAVLEKETAESKVADLTVEVEKATKAYEEALKNQGGSEELKAAEAAKAEAQAAYEQAVAERDNALNEVQDAEKKIEQIKQELEQALTEEERTKKEADLAQLHVTYHEKLNYLNTEAQSRIDNAQKEYDAATKTYESAKTAKEESDRLVQAALDEKTKAEKELEDLKNSNTNADQIIAEAKAEIERNNAILKELEVSIPQAQKDLAAAEKKVTSAEEAVKTAQTEVEQKQKAYDDIVASQSGNAEQIAKGSLGFFESVGASEDVLRILRECQDRYNTVIGAENDATSLENMKKSLDIIVECNRIREANGLEPLLITDRLMAISQVQTNASAEFVGHSHLYKVSENLAYGTDTPFTGWYTEEKERLDQIVSENEKYRQMRENGIGDYEICQAIYKDDMNLWHEIGHYQNIINPNNKYTGAGISQYSEKWKITDGQVFDFRLSSSDKEAFSDEEYIERFNQYYNDLMSSDTSKIEAALKELNDAKAKYESAKNDADVAKQEVQNKNDILSGLNQKKENANTAIKEAQKKIENANGSNTEKDQLIAEAQKKVDAANTKYNNAVADAAVKNDAMNNAYNDMDEKSIILMQAERAKQEAEKEVRESLEKIHASGQELIEDANEAQRLYEIARQKYTDAYRKAAELEFNLGKIEQSLPDKQNLVNEKNEAVQNAKTRKDEADKHYQDVLDNLGSSVTEAGKLKLQKEKELQTAKEELARVNSDIETKENEIKSLETKIKGIKADIVSKQEENRTLTDSMKKAEDLYLKAKKDYESISVPLDELKKAQDRLLEADVALSNLHAEKVEKEMKLEYATSEVEKCNKILEESKKALDEVKEITFEKAYHTPIENPEFTYLNKYVEEVKAAERALLTAKEEVTNAEQDYNDTKALYDVAKQEYIKAKADLAVAQQAYDEYIKDLNQNKPVITVGDKSHWKKGDAGLMFRSNVKHEDFIKVLINGVELSTDNYLASEGSTIITLKTEYLITLEDGEYQLTVVSKNGSANATFYVSRENDNNKPDVKPDEKPDVTPDVKPDENGNNNVTPDVKPDENGNNNVTPDVKPDESGNNNVTPDVKPNTKPNAPTTADKNNTVNSATTNKNQSKNPNTGDPVTGFGLYTGLMAASALVAKKLKKRK